MVHMKHRRIAVVTPDLSWFIPKPERWMADAVCAQVDPDAWFPEKGGSIQEAIRICQACPVRERCLEWALANDERFGVAGGMSADARRKLARQRAQEAA